MSDIDEEEAILEAIIQQKRMAAAAAALSGGVIADSPAVEQLHQGGAGNTPGAFSAATAGIVEATPAAVPEDGYITSVAPIIAPLTAAALAVANGAIASGHGSGGASSDEDERELAAILAGPVAARPSQVRAASVGDAARLDQISEGPGDAVHRDVSSRAVSNGSASTSTHDAIRAAVLGNAPRDVEALGSEEERLLRAVLSAIEGAAGSGGAARLEADSREIDAAIEGATRAAVAGVSSCGVGHAVVRASELYAIAAEVKRARGNVGDITCIAANVADASTSSVDIVVGCASGLLLLFDLRGRVAGVCGNASGGGEVRGAVCAVATAPDGQTIAAAYERCMIVLWSVGTLQPLRTIDELQQPVFRLQFMPLDSSRFAALNGDTLRLFSVTTVLGKALVRESEVEVERLGAFTDCACACLHGGDDAAAALGAGVIQSPTSSSRVVHQYIACVSSDELVVMRCVTGISTSFPLVHRESLPRHAGAEGAAAAVAWRVKNPFTLSLIVCYGRRVAVWALIQTANDATATIMKLHEIELPSPVRSLALLDAGCALVGDADEAFHVVDESASRVVETISVPGLRLAHLSHRSCGMRFQPGVSAARGIAYLAGGGHVVQCSVLGWEARLDALIVLRQWGDALSLAASFLVDDATTAVGLVDNTGKRRTDELRRHAHQMLLPSVARQMFSADATVEATRHLLLACIRFANRTGLCDTFLPAILEAARTVRRKPTFNAEAIFFDTLAVALCTEYADSESSGLSLPGPLVRQFVDFQLSTGAGDYGFERRVLNAKEVEATLMRVHGCDDALLECAFEHSMWRVVLAVWGSRRRKPDRALLELVRRGALDAAVDYLSLVVAHVGPPAPGTEARHATAVQEHIDQKRIVTRAFLQNDGALLTPGLVLRRQLWSVVETLTTDATVWDAVEASRVVAAAAHTSYVPKMQTTPVDMSQFFTLLVRATVGLPPRSTPAEEQDLNAAIADAFTLWCSAVAAGYATVPDPAMFFLSAVGQFMKLVSAAPPQQRITSPIVSLTPAGAPSGADAAVLAARFQRALCELLIAPNIVIKLVDVERVVLRSGFARVLAVIYCLMGRFAEAVDVFNARQSSTTDPGLEGQLFPFLEDAFTRIVPTGKSRDMLGQAVIERGDRLMALNPRRYAVVVARFLPEHRDAVVAEVTEDPLHFEFLRELLNNSAELSRNAELQTKFLRMHCLFDGAHLYQYLTANDAAIDYDVDEVLTAAQSAGIVDARVFLLDKQLRHGEAAQLLVRALGTALTQARQVAAGAAQRDAAAHPTPDIAALLQSATALVTSTFSAARDAGEEGADQQTSLTTSDDVVTAAWVNAQAGPRDFGDEVSRLVDIGFRLCHRQGKVHNANVAELWFALFDLFAKPKRVLQLRMERAAAARSQLVATNTSDFAWGDEPTASAVTSVTGVYFNVRMLRYCAVFSTLVLARMVRALPLTPVIQKIVQDAEMESYASYKPVLVGMLESLRFDMTSRDLCRRCASADVIDLSSELRRLLSGAITFSHGHMCFVCSQALAVAPGDRDGESNAPSHNAGVRVFSCGHGFHTSCAFGLSECPQCAIDAEAQTQQLFEHRTGSTGRPSTRSNPIVTGGPSGFDDEETFDVSRAWARLQKTRSRLDNADHRGTQAYDRRRNLLLTPAPTPATISEVGSSRPVHVPAGIPVARIAPETIFSRRILRWHERNGQQGY